MNYLATIANKGFMRYAHRLIHSARECGWRGKIVLFTEDEGVYANCDVVKIKRPPVKPIPALDDSRWLKCEIIDYFKNGDKVIFCDADAILLRGFWRLFSSDLACSWGEHDPMGDNRHLKNVCGVERKWQFKDCLISFTVNKKSKALFKTWRVSMMKSAELGRGTLLAFNMAESCVGGVEKIPREDVYYTVDRLNNKPLDGAINIQYGGSKGKRAWESDNLNKPWNTDNIVLDHFARAKK